MLFAFASIPLNVEIWQIRDILLVVTSLCMAEYDWSDFHKWRCHCLKK